MSAFQPSPDLLLVADCIYYEEVRKLTEIYKINVEKKKRKNSLEKALAKI